MAIPTSTVPAVKTYVYNTFVTAAATVPAPLADETQLLVVYGTPTDYTPDDMILVGDVVREVLPNAIVGSGGQFALHEKYKVEYWVDVWRGGDQMQTVDQRAYTILGALEQALRTDPSFGGLVLEAWPLNSESVSDWDDGNKGRNCRIKAEIDVFAIL